MAPTFRVVNLCDVRWLLVLDAPDGSAAHPKARSSRRRGGFLVAIRFAERHRMSAVDIPSGAALAALGIAAAWLFWKVGR
jgi:hypothetical protein